MTAQLRAVLDAYPMLPADLRRRLERDLAPLCVNYTGGDYSREDLTTVMTRENSVDKLRRLLYGVGCVQYLYVSDPVHQHVKHFHYIRGQGSESQIKACLGEVVDLRFAIMMHDHKQSDYETWKNSLMIPRTTSSTLPERP